MGSQRGDEPLSADLKANIINQLDHYFSDTNLCTDRHLLAKLQEGNGKVSIEGVHGWRSIRSIYENANEGFMDAVNESTVVEVVDNKFVQRRLPFDMAKAEVQLLANEGHGVQQKKTHADILAANPYLTKGMLKPTGFERNQSDQPLSPDERARNAVDYSPVIPITLRIETAIVRYRQVRKLHQETLRLFESFLNYCGLECRESQFTGGTSKQEQEELTKDELALHKQTNFVTSDIVDSLQEGDGKWIVDFEGVMKGFFSTRFPSKFEWYVAAKTEAACNVLRNFHKYLRRNEVCPEYNDQIEAASKVIDTAEREFQMLSKAQSALPGAFNVACSTLQGGTWSNVHYTGDWQTPEEATGVNIGFSGRDAKFIVMAGITAYASEEQADQAVEARGCFETVSNEQHVGLEVTGIVHLEDGPKTAKDFFSQDFIKDTIVPPMGKLICNRYHFPMANPIDVPEDLPPGHEKFEFLVDEETLNVCYVGMKMEATVMELDVGFCWLDNISMVYGSFFQWCWNEKIRDWKKPEPLEEIVQQNEIVHNPLDEHEPQQIEGLFHGRVEEMVKEKSEDVAEAAEGDDAWIEKATKKYFEGGSMLKTPGDPNQVLENSTSDNRFEERVDAPAAIDHDVETDHGVMEPWTRAAAAGGLWQGTGIDSSSVDGMDSEGDDYDEDVDSSDGIEESLEALNWPVGCNGNAMLPTDIAAGATAGMNDETFAAAFKAAD